MQLNKRPSSYSIANLKSAASAGVKPQDHIFASFNKKSSHKELEYTNVIIHSRLLFNFLKFYKSIYS